MLASSDDISEVAAYSAQKRPEALSDKFSTFVSFSSDELHTRKPERVDIIVAVPATRWSAEGQSVTLYTFARFRKYFTVIEDLAPDLARVYLQSGVLPMIAPVRAHLRQRKFAVDPNLLRLIHKQGLTLYWRRD